MQFKKRYVLRGALVLLCLFFICLAGFVAKQYYHLKIENFSARNDQTNSYYIDSRMSVDQVLDSTQVGYDNRWAPGSYKHLVPIGLGLCKSQDGRSWNLVCLETHQRTVDIKE